jgi:hypothetical protein
METALKNGNLAEYHYYILPFGVFSLSLRQITLNEPMKGKKQNTL